jgi:transcription elongation factor SPT6
MLEQKHYFTDDHDLAPMVYAEDFVNESPGLSTPEEVLRTARFIVATELGKDPQLRKLTRERFKNGALISVKPTEKGVNKIDEQHPYAVGPSGCPCDATCY